MRSSWEQPLDLFTACGKFPTSTEYPDTAAVGVGKSGLVPLAKDHASIWAKVPVSLTLTGVSVM
jgi:hypothetical protein